MLANLYKERERENKTTTKQTYNRNHAVGSQQRVKTLEKLDRKERRRLGPARKHVVHNIVKRWWSGAAGKTSHVVNGVVDDGGVVGGEAKETRRILVHNGVDLNDGRLDAVCDERRWRGSDPEAAGGLLAKMME